MSDLKQRIKDAIRDDLNHVRELKDLKRREGELYGELCHVRKLIDDKGSNPFADTKSNQLWHDIVAEVKKEMV